LKQEPWPSRMKTSTPVIVTVMIIDGYNRPLHMTVTHREMRLPLDHGGVARTMKITIRDWNHLIYSRRRFPFRGEREVASLYSCGFFVVQGGHRWRQRGRRSFSGVSTRSFFFVRSVDVMTASEAHNAWVRVTTSTNRDEAIRVTRGCGS